MSVDKASPDNFFSFNSVLRIDWSAHREIVFWRICLDHSVPKLFVIFNLLVENEVGRRARQRIQTFTALTEFNLLVTAKHFCPRLFQYQNPYLLHFTRTFLTTESPCLIFGIIWKPVINDYRALLPIYRQGHCVAASSIDLFCQENPLNAWRDLSNRAQAWQIIARACFPLLNVVWTSSLIEAKLLLSLVVDLAWSFPLEVCPLFRAFVFRQVVVVNWLRCCWKARILPGLACLDDSLVVYRLQSVWINFEVLYFSLALWIKIKVCHINFLICWLV